jgi:hypothetical protein
MTGFLQLAIQSAEASVTPVPPPWEALGFTITALMLFVAGAIGAWCRVVLSRTQNTWSQRTVVDVVVGGSWAALLPRLAPLFSSTLIQKLDEWDAVQKSCLALLLGVNGSWLWTTFAWRIGRIITPEQAATGMKPPEPEVGVLKNTSDAKAAVQKFHADEAARDEEDNGPGTNYSPLKDR